MSNELIDPAVMAREVDRIDALLRNRKQQAKRLTQKCDNYEHGLIGTMQRLAHDKPQAFKSYFETQKPDYEFELDSQGRISGWRHAIFLYEHDPDAEKYIQQYARGKHDQCVKRSS